MLEENPELQKKISLFRSRKRREKYLLINEKILYELLIKFILYIPVLWPASIIFPSLPAFAKNK